MNIKTACPLVGMFLDWSPDGVLHFRSSLQSCITLSLRDFDCYWFLESFWSSCNLIFWQKKPYEWGSFYWVCHLISKTTSQMWLSMRSPTTVVRGGGGCRWWLVVVMRGGWSPKGPTFLWLQEFSNFCELFTSFRKQK